MALPNFLIVGAAKCGTTTLWSWLRKHPDVFMPSDKEPCFFVQSIPPKSTFSAYQSLFRSGYARIGEASVPYLYDPVSPSLIKDRLGIDTKIIICIRNPADMAYSLWKHNTRDRMESYSFPQALEQEIVRISSTAFRNSNPGSHINFYYLERAKFGEQITRYYNAFNESNILVIKLEDMMNDHEITRKRVLSFLDLDYVEYNFEKKNVTGGVYSSLLQTALLKPSSLIRKPLKVLPSNIKAKLWSFAHQSNRKKSNNIYPPMQDAIKRKIMAELRDDLILLRHLSGINYE